MSERDPLEALAEDYRGEGYDVIVRPPRSALPAFLEYSDIDLLARMGDQLVAISLKQGEIPSSSAATSTLLAAILDADYGKSLARRGRAASQPPTRSGQLY